MGVVGYSKFANKRRGVGSGNPRRGVNNPRPTIRKGGSPFSKANRATAQEGKAYVCIIPGAMVRLVVRSVQRLALGVFKNTMMRKRRRGVSSGLVARQI